MVTCSLGRFSSIVVEANRCVGYANVERMWSLPRRRVLQWEMGGTIDSLLEGKEFEHTRCGVGVILISVVKVVYLRFGLRLSSHG